MSSMSVELDSIWINVADDPSDAIAFHRPVDALSRNTVVPVEVRELTGGRRRTVRSGTGVSTPYAVTFPRCSREQVAWLVAHAGEVVCVRDHVGTKIFGIYKEVPEEISVQFRDWIGVRLSIESTTHDESV